MFCKHEWEKQTDVTFPSAWEQLTGSINDRSVKTAPYWMFEKKHLLVLSCKKCGKLERYETESA